MASIARTQSLGQIVDAVINSQRLTWMPNGDPDYCGDPLNGVVRHFSDSAGGAGLASWAEGDIEDKFVRVSTAVEHWICVRDLAEWMESEQAALSWQ